MIENNNMIKAVGLVGKLVLRLPIPYKTLSPDLSPYTSGWNLWNICSSTIWTAVVNGVPGPKMQETP